MTNIQAKFRTRIALFLPCAFLLFLLSCGKQKPESKPPDITRQYGAFHLSLDSNQVIVDSISVDLNSDGTDEVVLTIAERRDTSNTSRLQFNLVHVFELQPNDSSYKSIFTDVVESGERIYFRDVTGSGQPEVIVDVNTGGNDPVASHGVHVYGFRADEIFTLLFYIQSGDPQFFDVNDDGVEEILVSAQYWGVSSRADAIAYIQGIYGFDGNAYVFSNRRFSAFYQGRIAALTREYIQGKKAASKQEHARALYQKTMELFLWIAAKGDISELDTLWEAEKEILQALLPEELFDEIEYFIENEKSGFSQPLSERVS